MAYSIRLPDGTLVENIPDEVTPQDAKARIIKAYPQFAPETSTTRRIFGDVPVGVGRGAVSGIRMIADIFGADNPASQALKEGEKYLAELMSDKARANEQEAARILKEAEDKGVLESVKLGAQALIAAPVEFLTQAFGTAVPAIAGGIAGGAAKLGTVGIRAIQAGTGAAMGTGLTKGNIYEVVKEELIRSKVPEEVAEQRAKAAQAYTGENWDQIIVGGLLGGAASIGPLERIFARIPSISPEVAAKNLFVRAGVSGVKEAVPEAAQAFQEQVAQNIALQREGFDVPTFRGAVSNATLEGLAGFGLGAPIGALEGKPGDTRPPGQQTPTTPPPAAPGAPMIDEEELTPEEEAELQAMIASTAPPPPPAAALPVAPTPPIGPAPAAAPLVSGPPGPVAPRVSTEATAEIESLQNALGQIQAQRMDPTLSPDDPVFQELDQQEAAIQTRIQQLSAPPEADAAPPSVTPTQSIETIEKKEQKAPTYEPFEKLEGVETTFKTERGSTYAQFADKGTIRNRSGAKHTDATTGLQPKSYKTFFVDEQALNNIGPAFQFSDAEVRMDPEVDANGKLTGIHLTYPKGYGPIEPGRQFMRVPASTEPQVGMYPVEIYNNVSPVGDSGSGVHFGTKIIEVNKQAPKPIGAGFLVQRQQVAGDRFIEAVIGQFGLTREEATQALSTMVKEKIVELDPNDGQFRLKDGRFWDADIMRKAAAMAAPPLTQPPAQPPAPPVAPVVEPEVIPEEAMVEAPVVTPPVEVISAPPAFRYLVTNTPAYEGIEPLTLEDADFELEVLQSRAEKGRLTPEVFAQNEIAKRLDTSTLMTINDGLRSNPVATIQSLRDTLRFATEAPSITPPAAPDITAPPAVEAQDIEEPLARSKQEVQTELNRIRTSLKKAKTAVKKKLMPESEVTNLEARVSELEDELAEAKAGPRQIKYRSAKGNTWTGKGKSPPKWLRQKLAAGFELSDFEIRPELGNKSEVEVELEKPPGFGRPMPATRPPAEYERLSRQIDEAQEETPNLFTVLKGKLTAEEVNDISPEKSVAFLRAPKGTGVTLADLVDGDLLLDYLPDEMQKGHPDFDPGVSSDYIKGLLRQDPNLDPEARLSYYTRAVLIPALESQLQEIEQTLEPEDVNQLIQEIVAEERAAIADIEAGAIEEQERGPAVPAIPAEFSLEGQTPEQLAELQRRELSGEAEAERDRLEAEEAARAAAEAERKIADQKRETFGLEPTPSAPTTRAAAPSGDLFGATGITEQPTRKPRAVAAEPSPIEAAIEDAEFKEDMGSAQDVLNDLLKQFRLGGSDTTRIDYDPDQKTIVTEKIWNGEALIKRPQFDALASIANKSDTSKGASYSILIKDTPTESLILKFKPSGLKPLDRFVGITYSIAESKKDTNVPPLEDNITERMRQLGVADFEDASEKVQESYGVSKPVADSYVRAVRKQAEAIAKSSYGKATEKEFQDAYDEAKKLRKRMEGVSKRRETKAEAKEDRGQDIVNNKAPNPDLPRDERLVLMACCATKKEGKGPALDIYQGVFFQTYKNKVKKNAEPYLGILSAKYGFIRPDQEIETYEQVMDKERADALLAEGDQLAKRILPPGGPTIKDVLIVGSKEYQRVMKAAVYDLMQQGRIDKNASINVTKGGIGEQRAELGRYLSSIKPVDIKEVLKPKAAKESLFEGEEAEAPMAKVRSKLVRFASGMSSISDLAAGSDVISGNERNGMGVVASRLSKNALNVLANDIFNRGLKTFVDSGAYSARDQEAQPDFDTTFKQYDQILGAVDALNEAEKQWGTEIPPIKFVMPDVLGNQDATVDLIEQYKNIIQSYMRFNGSEPIIPLQTGKKPLAQFYDEVVQTLGGDNFTVGIPQRVNPPSKQELGEFLSKAKPKKIHFLGAGASSNLNPLLAVVAQYSPDTEVSADASIIQAQVATQGKGKDRRALIQDILYDPEDPDVLKNRFAQEYTESVRERQEAPTITPGQQRNLNYWRENVAPAIRDYLTAYKNVGVERLERARFKPEGISATEWLLKVRSQKSVFVKGGRKVSETGIQMLSKKDLLPTVSGDGEVLRKAMLKAIQAINKAPGYNSDWIANMEAGSYDGIPDIQMMLKGTEEEQKGIMAVAKQLGATPVYFDPVRNIGLVRGYGTLSGRPIYVMTKGSIYGTADIEQTKLPEFLPFKAEMVERKNKLEEEDAKAHKDNPFIKFEDGIALSDGIDSSIKGVITEWKSLLGLGNVNIYFSTIQDAVKNRANFTGPHRVVGSGTLDDASGGSMRRMDDGSYYVLFEQSTSKTKMLETIAHELGHVHEREAYQNAPQELKDKLKEAHAKWVAQRKGKTAREAVDMLRAKTTAQTTSIAPGKKYAEQLSPYWSSFSEWYADQVSRWAVTDEKPVGVVEKFFARLAAALRRFYQTLKGKKYLPDETFVEYLKQVKPTIVETIPGPIKEPVQIEMSFNMLKDLFGSEKNARDVKELMEVYPPLKKLPPGRSPELAAAAAALKAGTLTAEEYDQLVGIYKPIPFYTQAMRPVTQEQVSNALYSDKRLKIGTKIADGTPIGLRLDIPAWNNHKVHVVTIHEKRKSKSETGKVITYDSSAKAKDVTFAVGDERKSLNIATGEAKNPVQTMEGKFVNVSPEQAYAEAQRAIKDPSYVQVGIDPTRHSYFFDRRTTLPILSADEVIQIGNMILAKNPVFGKKSDFLYNIDSGPIDDGSQDAAKRERENKETLAALQEIRPVDLVLPRKVDNYASTAEGQRTLAALTMTNEEMDKALSRTSYEGFTADNFMRRARQAVDEGALSADVFAVIQAMYMEDPKLLDGLRLDVKQRYSPEEIKQRQAEGLKTPVGAFAPLERIVNLYTGTKGVTNPLTIRHEITHTLEQMMTPAQRKAVLNAYFAALKKAAKKHKDARSREFFDSVIKYLNEPFPENRAAMNKLLPSLDFYQFTSPSEFWAVNAEKLMAQRLGTAWDRLKKSLRKMFEKLKNIFGFDNGFVVHDVFDKIMSGSKERMTTSMLADFVKADGQSYEFLENIDDDSELVRRYHRVDTPMLDHAPAKRMMINAAGVTKDFFKEMASNPSEALRMTFNSLNRGIMWLRNKNIWFGSGINEADRIRYNGAVKTAEGLATASLALDNMIRGGNIATQTLFLGGIEYNPNTLMYGAVRKDQNMTKVYEAEAELKKRLGEQLGTNVIQGYLEAKRSRSIKDEVEDRKAIVDGLNEAIEEKVAELKALDATPTATKEQKDAVNRELRQMFKEFRQSKEELDTIRKISEDKVTMSEQEIEDFIQREEVHPELKEILTNFNAVNQNLLKFWRDVDLISEKRYQRLSAIKDYVPWYRIMNDEEDVHSPLQATTRSATNIGREKLFKPGKPSVINDFTVEEGQDVFKIQPGQVNAVKVNSVRLKPDQYEATPNGEIRIKTEYRPGDTVVIETQREIENMIDNMTRNVMRMTMNGLRKYAANRIVSEYATRDNKGRIMTFPKIDREKGRFDFIYNGRRTVVEIRDPLIAEAALGMETVGMKMFWEPLAAAANFTRRTITVSPVFQFKQVFKDAPTAALVTGVKRPDLLMGGVMRDFVGAVRNDDPIAELLRTQGIGGFYSPARTPEADVKRRIGIINNNTFDYVMKALDHFGDSSDMAQRIAIYKRVMAETGDESLALYQAANVINFLRHGSGPVAQALVRTVPFLNAYAQSIDVLYDALRGGGLRGKDRAAALRQLALTGSLLAGTTILYTMLVGDDDDYLKMDDQSKIRSYMIPGTDVVLPMNTSAAFFFKAIPELITNKIINEGTENEVDARRLRTALKESAVDLLLGPTPVPSVAKPFIEISLNYNFFTSRPVTPRGMEDLDAYQQYDFRTSEAAKLLSGLTGTKDTRALNPMEADHLIRSIFGTAGAMVAWSSNVIDASARPEMGLKEMPITGAFMRPEVPRGREDLFYKLKDSTDRKYNTYMALVGRGKQAEAQDYFLRHPNLVAYYEYTSEMATQLKKINEAIRFIGETNDPSFTPKIKREEIQNLLNLKQDVLEGVEQFRKEAYSD